MLTWKRGRGLLTARLREDSVELRAFLDSLFAKPPARVQGTAVFLTAEPDVTPRALLHNLEHNKVLHEQNLFVTVQHHEVPWVSLDQRVDVEPLGHRCWRVRLHFGFENDPDLPQALQLVRDRGIEFDDERTSYFLSRDSVVPMARSGDRWGAVQSVMWPAPTFIQLPQNAPNGSPTADPFASANGRSGLVR